MNILTAVLVLSTLLPVHGLLPNKQINIQNLGVSCNNRNQRTQLFANLWERMQIEEDEEPMWYLINCVAGMEVDLLRQCLQRTEDMDDVIKLVVPMQTSHRSHGANRMVTDVKVKYQGYVFGKLRLTEETYLAIQGLDLCRSWMGTVNQQGYKKLPPAPLPLNEDEIENFGLENIEELQEEEEEEADIIVDADDDKEDKEAAAIEEVVQNVYKGLRVGDMIKVTAKNKFFDEDGIVRRLKDNKIFLRFYTYGTMFEEWLDPSEVRKLSDEEVLKGLGGPAQPITQRDIDGPDRKDRNDYGENRGDMRRNLQDTMGGVGQRNRRQDRNERRFSRGDSLQDRDQERKNWDWYKDNERKQRDGAYSDGKTDIRGSSQRSNPQGDVDSQWGRGPQQPRQSNRRDSQANSGDDWSAFVSNSNKPAKKQDTDDFFDSLYNDLSNELENENSGSKPNNGGEDDFFGWLMDEIEDDESSKAKSPKAAKASEEDDFFASLEMELQDDTPPKKAKKTSPPSENLDDFFADLANFDDDKTGGPAPALNGDADDFFANLEAELETELTTSKPASTKAPNQGVADDFFADLELELETELKAEPAVKATKTENADDFFADLESDFLEIAGGVEAEPEVAETKTENADDFFADLESELESDDFFATTKPATTKAPTQEVADDFFADLELELETELKAEPAVKATNTEDPADFFADLESDFAEIAGGMEAEPEVAAPAMTTTEAPAPSSGPSLDSGSLKKLTVPVLKDMLRDRGLKVSGKKADLIERLAS